MSSLKARLNDNLTDVAFDESGQGARGEEVGLCQKTLALLLWPTIFAGVTKFRVQALACFFRESTT